MAEKYMIGNVFQVAMLKILMKCSDLRDSRSSPSVMDPDTMVHMCTQMMGNGAQAKT